MKQHIAYLTLLVNDYDEAIDFYTNQLSFKLVEDNIISVTKRWVIVTPPGSNGCSLLLAKAATKDQEERVGDQTGGRVFLFLHTDDIKRDYDNMIKKGIEFVREPLTESYGTVAVFRDLYGNLWDLVEPYSGI